MSFLDNIARSLGRHRLKERREPKPRRKEEPLIPAAGVAQQPPEMEEAVGETDEPQYTSEQRRLRHLADRLYRAYVMAKRKFLAAYRRGTSYFEPDDPNVDRWLQLAQWLLENGCDDPELFIRTQFDAGLPPSISQLQTPASLERYRDGKENIYRVLAADRSSELIRLAFELRQLATQQPSLPLTAYIDAVLRDMGLPLSPLLRYCCALQCSLAPTAALFRDAARQQVMELPNAYMAVWDHDLPKEFKESVQAALAGD